jgi:molybdopterin synthase sulfur carrier subunit
VTYDDIGSECQRAQEDYEMSVVVRIPTPLRRVTNGQEKASVEGGTLVQIIDSLETQYPGIRERLCDETGDLRHFVNIYINGEDVRFLQGLETSTKSGDEISIVPAVAGGASTWF